MLMLIILIALIIWAAIIGRAMQVWGAWTVATARARALEADLGVALTDRGDLELVTQLGGVPVERCRPLATYVAGRKAHDIPLEEYAAIRRDLHRRQNVWHGAATAALIATAVAAVVCIAHPSYVMLGVAGVALLAATVATVAARSLRDMEDSITTVERLIANEDPAHTH